MVKKDLKSIQLEMRIVEPLLQDVKCLKKQKVSLKTARLFSIMEYAM